MPAHSPSRIFLARARPDPDALTGVDGTTGALDVRAPVTAGGVDVRDPSVPEDVVIDLTGAPAMAPDVVTRWPRWLLVVLALVALAAGALAVANYSAALGWRDRAVTAERRAARSSADAATQRGDALEARRARDAARQRRRAMAEQLAVSEADVAALEARVFVLASNRARAQDLGQGVAPASADALVRALRAQVDSCIAQVDAVRDGLAADSETASWRRAFAAAKASCEQVAADLEALATTAR